MTNFKRKNIVLQLALATALVGGSFAANAAFVTGWNPAQVASELPITGTALTSGTLLKSTAQITPFTPSGVQFLKVDVTLTGGATFTTSPGIVCNALGAAAGSAIVPTLGGAGSNNAIYSIPTSAIGGGVGTATVTSCSVSAVAVSLTTGAHSNITESITFTYDTLSSSTVSDTLVAFQSGLTASVTVGTDVVAQVGSGFITLANGATLVSAGLISWKGDGSAGVAAVGTPIQLTDALGATSGSITVAGASLVAAKTTAGVFLVTATTNCTVGPAVYSVTGGASSVTFTGVSATDLSAGLNVCVQFNGTTAIPAGSITATLGGTPVTGYSLPSVSSQTLVNVTRNGTTLVAPLVNVPSGWISRLVLVNRGSAAANYTVSAVSESGATVTLTGAAASGSLTAGSNSVIDLSTLMTVAVTGTAGSRGSLLVTVDGVNANIDGLYQLVNAATGNLSNYTLINK